MPMDRSKYPANWDDIATAVKEATGWRCELCGLQCRRPDEPHTTHKITLTVAHLNHTESDCRPENLAAMCAPCHLKYDNVRRRLQRAIAKRLKRVDGQVLFRQMPTEAKS